MQETIAGLTATVERLENRVDRLHREFRRRNLAVFAVCLALVVATVVIARLQSDLDARLAADHRHWCPLLQVFTDTPPSTPLGVKLAEQGAQLYGTFGCPARSQKE